MASAQVLLAPTPFCRRDTEEATAFAGTVIATEKVDGTNSRVICLPDGCSLLGSREELLYGKGDLIGNPALGIKARFEDYERTLKRKKW
jgi:hypothetical protein